MLKKINHCRRQDNVVCTDFGRGCDWFPTLMLCCEKHCSGWLPGWREELWLAGQAACSSRLATVSSVPGCPGRIIWLGWGKGDWLARQGGSFAGRLGLSGSGRPAEETGSGCMGKRASAIQGKETLLSQTGLGDSGWQEDLTDQLGNVALAGWVG